MTELTSEIVRELLHYDPDTGVFTWRERGKHWFKNDRDCKAWNGRHAGKKTGRLQTMNGGYQRRRVRLLGRECLEHRLAWMWMTDDPVPEEIDHKNRNATDNRWSNLRASDSTDNGHNMSLSQRNTSGVSGVSWFRPIGKWQARCMVNRKYHSLGYFDDIQEAAKAVEEFRAANGFNPEHGKEKAHYAST